MYDVIPQNVLNYLTVNELGLHLAGMPKLDVDELKEHTRLYGYSEGDVTIKNFFKVLKEYDETM